MQISEEILEKVKEQNDIVDVISESVRLKRSGRNFLGLCPFHNEKTPSFSVSQEKQIYKCFSCNEAGNVITFVMKNRNIQFTDAVKILADRANISIEEDNQRKDPKVQKKELIYKANLEAARFFYSNLNNTKQAKEYFLNRGISEVTIRRFGLGFARDNWNNLLNHLKKLGFNDDILLESGLISVSERTKNKYDRFRNRVMFPVFDYMGRVIAFGGRVLDDSKPKYLNSPETLIFHKATNLYGLNFAIKNKISDRYFIIVEGYMDVIALHQAGITNAVASLGTALTKNQARLLKRYADKVIIAYDSDVAGQEATERGLDILKEVGLDVKVLNIPKGKDPDEFIKANGKEEFLSLVDKAENLIDYRIRRATKGLNLLDSNDKSKYGHRVANVLVIADPIERDVYVQKVSEQTGIRQETIYSQLKNIIKKGSEDYMEENEKKDLLMNNKKENGTQLYLEPAFIKAERSLMKLCLNDEYFEYIQTLIDEDKLITLQNKHIFSLIKDVRKGSIKDIVTFIESKSSDLEIIKEAIKIKEQEVLVGREYKKLIEDFSKQLTNYKINVKLEELKQNQKLLDKQGNFEEAIKIANEIKNIKERSNN